MALLSFDSCHWNTATNGTCTAFPGRGGLKASHNLHRHLQRLRGPPTVAFPSLSSKAFQLSSTPRIEDPHGIKSSKTLRTTYIGRCAIRCHDEPMRPGWYRDVRNEAVR